jgi:hypothetical protein
MSPIFIIAGMIIVLVFMVYLASLIGVDKAGSSRKKAHQDAEKQKNIKEKHYHMGQRLSKPVNWRVLLSHEIQRHLPDQKTEAIIRYRQLTGADVQDATQTIAYHIAYPNHVPAHFVHYELTDEQIGSLHRMLRRGKRAEAHKRYQEMTGIDQFAADIGLDILEQQLLVEEEQFATIRDVADADADEIQEQQVSHREQKGSRE